MSETCAYDPRMNPDTDSKEAAKSLGHGSHWEALGLEGEPLMQFLQGVVPHAGVVGEFPAPWPGEPCREIVQLELPQGSLAFAAIVGRNNPQQHFEVLSAFPILAHTTEWTVQVDGTSDCYGTVEGTVHGETATDHPLEWFAPRFGIEAAQWREPGRARVKLFAALALAIAPFDAEPIVVTEGPRIDELREELRAEGRHDEADRRDLSVTYETSMMRTIFSSFHDHHEFVGRVCGVRAIRPRPEIHGWRIDLECLPDDTSERRLPLYVFAAALKNGYMPKRGDLVQGLAWLQGSLAADPA